MGFGIGKDFECECVKAVPGENRGRLVEHLVDGRLPATNVVIVHARKIVMDQRIDVDRLDRSSDTQGPISRNAKQPRCGNRQEWSKSLSATDRCMAHRSVKIVAAIVARHEQTSEQLINLAANPFGLGVQLEPRPVDRLNRHRRG